jgi:hypothetical protein
MARQTAAKLYTAGPNIPDRDIRLDLLGPAAFGSGPAGARRVTRTYPGWSGLMVVATVSRTGTGRDQPRCAVIHGHVPCCRWDTAPLRDVPYIREALRVSGFHFAQFSGNPNSSNHMSEQVLRLWGVPQS